MPRPPYAPRLVAVARRLRREATFPERLLWSRLRAGRLGVRFCRQHPVGRHVVDFYAPDAGLVVEVDGRSHDGRGPADEAREAALRAAGCRVLRVTNDDVLADIEGVLVRIARGLEGSPL